MTMVEAAQQALRHLGRPATAKEIYEEIVRRDLFTFGAKDPVSTLGSNIRRRTAGSKTLRGGPMFRAEERGVYALLQ